MIKSFKHKGLEQFYKTGNKAGIQTVHSTKLRILLTALDAATQPLDMNAPNWKLHQLKGSLQDYWAVSVSGNWRLTFKFIGDNAEVVDYQDYH